MTRLGMNAGRNREVRPADVVGFLLNETTLPREAIGAINIDEQMTTFDVREEYAHDLVDALRGMKFKGRKLLVGPVED